MFAQLFKRFRAALRAADIAKPQARFIRQQTIAQRARLFKRRRGGEDSGIVGQHCLGKAALVAAGNVQRRILHGYGGDGHNRARAAHFFLQGVKRKRLRGALLLYAHPGDAPGKVAHAHHVRSHPRVVERILIHGQRLAAYQHVIDFPGQQGTKRHGRIARRILRGQKPQPSGRVEAAAVRIVQAALNLLGQAILAGIVQRALIQPLITRVRAVAHAPLAVILRAARFVVAKRHGAAQPLPPGFSSRLGMNGPAACCILTQRVIWRAERNLMPRLHARRGSA